MTIKINRVFRQIICAAGTLGLLLGMSVTTVSPAHAGGHIENACVAALTAGDTDPINRRQNAAMCVCIDKYLRAAGITPAEERKLTQNFNMELVKTIFDRAPDQGKACNTCMNEAYKKNS
jgi:hypothetical protein